MADWTEPIRAGKEELTVGKIIGSGEIFGFSGDVRTNFWPLKIGGENGAVPPIQPHLILFEGDTINYEDFVYSWVSTFTGTGGLKLSGVKINEKFFYTEASRLHGEMLQKVALQRKDATEYLKAIQGLKTAITNIESDLEKLDEQLKAFQDGDWQQIRAIFADNYGGPQRSFTAIVRNLPIARMALTWFFRLEVPYPDAVPVQEFAKLKVGALLPAGKYSKPDPEKVKKISEKLSRLKKAIKEGATRNKKAMIEKIDELVKAEQMNVAIAQFLKRKVEEFWNWVANYVEWLATNRNRIYENLIQQKANMKMYMRWAADHIMAAQRLEMDPSIASALSEYIHKGTPREAVMMEYIFYPSEDDRPDIVEACRPWVPILFTTFLAGLNVEVNTKYMEGAFVLHYGYTHKKTLEKILSLLDSNSRDLISVMINAGALTEDELPRLFTQEEINELKGVAQAEGKESLHDRIEDFYAMVGKAVWNAASLFGISLTKKGLPWARQIRAASISMDLAMKGIKNFKKGNGMLVLE